MTRPKQIIINDLMGELNKFGANISNIKDAIQSKGVSSTGKLFNFAEEINSIKQSSYYDKFASAISYANFQGYSDEDIIEILRGLPKKEQPQPEPEPPTEDYINDNLVDIQYDDVSKVKNYKNITFNKATSVGMMAFNNVEFIGVFLPKVTSIDSYAFGNATIYEISMPSFVWEGSNINTSIISSLDILVVSEQSVPTDETFENLPNLVVYTSNKTKKWDKASKQWKAI